MQAPPTRWKFVQAMAITLRRERGKTTRAGAVLLVQVIATLAVAGLGARVVGEGS